MKIKELIQQDKVEEILNSSWGISFHPYLCARFSNKLALYSKGLITEEEMIGFKIHCSAILMNDGDTDIPELN